MQELKTQGSGRSRLLDRLLFLLELALLTSGLQTVSVDRLLLLLGLGLSPDLSRDLVSLLSLDKDLSILVPSKFSFLPPELRSQLSTLSMASCG